MKFSYQLVTVKAKLHFLSTALEKACCIVLRTLYKVPHTEHEIAGVPLAKFLHNMHARK